MDGSSANRLSPFFGLTIHVALLLVGIVLGRYLIIATTDPPSEPVAIEYHVEFIQAPPRFLGASDLASTMSEDSNVRRTLWIAGWNNVGSPALVSAFKTPIKWHITWRYESSAANNPDVANSILLRSAWANSRIATQIVIWQEDISFSHLVDLAVDETRIIRIDDCERVGSPGVFMLIKAVPIFPDNELNYPVTVPPGGTAAPANSKSFAPGSGSR